MKVSTEKTKYRLSKFLLIHYPDYLRKALSGSWKEAKDEYITLDDIEAPVLDVFVKWLYTQTLPDSPED